MTTLASNLVSLNAGAVPQVTQAIKTASAQTGVDFSYLLQKANVESSMNPNAKAKGSSATGLFQFVEQTWLHVVKNYGAKYGMGAAADRITVSADGTAHVNDTQTKQAILALRKNPTLAASMAAELTNENKKTLQTEVGGKIGSTELYLAHFLGANGAATFLNTMHDQPNAKAADYLPTAAASNPSVFYTKTGQPRTLSQIYQHFAQKFDAAPSAPSSTTMMAANSPSLSTSNVIALNGVIGMDSTGTVSATPSAYSALNAYKPDATLASPFASMLLAQMDLGNYASSSSQDSSLTAEEQRKHGMGTMLSLAA